MFHQRWRHRLGQAKGEGRLGALITLVVVAFVIYVLVKYVPMRIQRAEYGDFVEGRLREYAIRERTMEKVIESCVSEAEKLQIPVTEDNIRINEAESKIEADIDYTIVLKMVWGDWTHNMHVHSEVPRI